MQRLKKTMAVVTVSSTAVSFAAPALTAQESNETNVAETQDDEQQVASEDEAVTRFFDTGHTYCDAAVIAAFWKEATPYDGKVSLGRKIIAVGQAQADGFLAQARVQTLSKPNAEWPCTYEAAGFTYEDAEVLAKHWGKKEVFEAKLKIEKMAIMGKEEELHSELNKAKQEHGGASNEQQAAPDEEALHRFFDTGHTYCDAAVIAAFWNESDPFEAKATFGRKIIALGQAQTEGVLAQARAQALSKPDTEWPCNYADAGFSYEDAELLAKYWGKKEVYDAKLKIEKKAIMGKIAEIKDDLKKAKHEDGGPTH